MAWCRRCDSRLPDGSRYCLTCQRMLEEDEVSRLGLFRTAQRRARQARAELEKRQQQEQKPSGPLKWVLAIALPVLLVVFAELLEAESGTVLGALLLLIIYLALSYAPSMLDRSEEVPPDPQGRDEAGNGGRAEGGAGERPGVYSQLEPSRTGRDENSASYTD